MKKIIIIGILLSFSSCLHSMRPFESSEKEGFVTAQVIDRSPALAGRSSLYPDRQKTPGVARRQTSAKDVCTPGFTASIRNVPSTVRDQVFISYFGAVPADPLAYEIDHFISLELGGGNDIRNLWPQPYAPLPGARQKDVVETFLKHEICKNSITLAQAQHIISIDWYACYLSIQNKLACVVPKTKPIFLTITE